MRYFFNLHDDVVTDDEEGADLADLDAAIAYATDGARCVAAASVRDGHLSPHHRIEIVDGQGTLLHTLRFDEAVAIRK